MSWEISNGNCILLSRFYSDTRLKCFNTVDKMNSGRKDLSKNDALPSVNSKRTQSEENLENSDEDLNGSFYNEKVGDDTDPMQPSSSSSDEEGSPDIVAKKKHNDFKPALHVVQSIDSTNNINIIEDETDTLDSVNENEKAVPINPAPGFTSSEGKHETSLSEGTSRDTAKGWQDGTPISPSSDEERSPDTVAQKKHSELSPAPYVVQNIDSSNNDPQDETDTVDNLKEHKKAEPINPVPEITSSRGEHETSLSILSDGGTSYDSTKGWQDGVPIFTLPGEEHEDTESVLSDSLTEWKDGIPVLPSPRGEHEDTESVLSDSVTGWKDGIPILPLPREEHTRTPSAEQKDLTPIPGGEHEKPSSTKGILKDREKPPVILTGRKYTIVKLPSFIGEHETAPSTEGVLLDGEEKPDRITGWKDGIPMPLSPRGEHEETSSTEIILSGGEATPGSITGWKDGVPILLTEEHERSPSTENALLDGEKSSDSVTAWKDGIPIFSSSRGKHEVSTKSKLSDGKKTPDLVTLSREEHEKSLSDEDVVSVGETTPYITTGWKDGIPVFPSAKREHKISLSTESLLSDGEKTPDSVTGWKDGIPTSPAFEGRYEQSMSTMGKRFTEGEETPDSTGWKNGIPVLPTLSTISEENLAEKRLDRYPSKDLKDSDKIPGDLTGQENEISASEEEHVCVKGIPGGKKTLKTVSGENERLSTSQNMYEGQPSTPSEDLTVGLQTSENVTRWKSASVFFVQLVELETSPNTASKQHSSEVSLELQKFPSTVRKKYSSEASFESYSGWEDGIPAFHLLERSESSVTTDSKELTSQNSSEISSGWKDGIPVFPSVEEEPEEHSDEKETTHSFTAKKERLSASPLPTEQGEIFLREVGKEHLGKQETPSDPTKLLAPEGIGGRILKEVPFEMEVAGELFQALAEHYQPKLKKDLRNYAIYLVITDSGEEHSSEEREEATDEQNEEPTEETNILSTMNVNVLKWSADGKPEIIQITPKPTPGSVPLVRVVEKQTIIQGARPMRVSVAHLVPMDEPTDVVPENLEEPHSTSSKTFGGIKDITEEYTAAETELEQSTAEEDEELLELTQSFIRLLQEATEVVEVSTIDTAHQSQDTTDSSEMGGAPNEKEEDINETKNMEDPSVMTEKSDDEKQLECDKCDHCVCSSCTCSDCVHIRGPRDACVQTEAIYLVAEDDETEGDKNTILQVFNNAAMVLEVRASVADAEADAEQDTPTKTAVISIRPVMVGQLIPHRCTPSEEDLGEVTLEEVNTKPVCFQVLLDENGRLQEPISEVQEALNAELLRQDAGSEELINQWYAAMPDIDETVESIVHGLTYVLPEILVAKGLCSMEDIHIQMDAKSGSSIYEFELPDKEVVDSKTSSATEHVTETDRLGQESDIVSDKESYYSARSFIVEDKCVGCEPCNKVEKSSTTIPAGDRSEDQKKETKHEHRHIDERGYYVDEEGDEYYDALDCVCS